HSTRAVLRVAPELGIPCGSWCPKRRKVEDGPIPEPRATKQSGVYERPRAFLPALLGAVSGTGLTCQARWRTAPVGSAARLAEQWHKRSLLCHGRPRPCF